MYLVVETRLKNSYYSKIEVELFTKSNGGNNLNFCILITGPNSYHGIELYPSLRIPPKRITLS